VSLDPSLWWEFDALLICAQMERDNYDELDGIAPDIWPFLPGLTGHAGNPKPEETGSDPS
jgi:hypothetical protein